MFPILPNGEQDVSRAAEVTFVAAFTDLVGSADEPNLNTDGPALAFYDYLDVPAGSPVPSDVYTMTGLQDIIAAQGNRRRYAALDDADHVAF